MPEPRFFGWRAVWAAFAIAIFAWGIGFYGPGIFLEALRQRHGWPISLISAAITTHFLLGALLVARFPAIEARFGLWRVILAGGLLTALGLVGWSSASAPWQIFAASAFSGAGWALTSGAAINAIVAPWFEARRPAAISMAFNGASMGGVIFAPLWALLITQLGFPAAGALVALATLVAVSGLALTVLRWTPESREPRVDAIAAALPAGRGIWAEPRFLRLAAGFSIGAFALVGLLAHLFSLITPALGKFGAGLAMSLITLCAVLGRSLLGWLLPAGADRRRAAALNFAAQVTGSVTLLLAAGDSVPLILLGCVLFGLTVGNMLSLPPLIAQAEFTRGDVGRVVALITAVNQAVYAFAPASFGLIRDLTGSGTGVLLAAALLQGTAAAILWPRLR